MTTRAPIAALALVLALLFTPGCGGSTSDDEVSTSADESTTRYTLVLDEPADPELLAGAAQTLVARFEALGISASVTEVADGLEVEVPGTVISRERLADLVAAGALQFRPVLDVLSPDGATDPATPVEVPPDACRGTGVDPPGDDQATESVWVSECDPSTGELVARYRVGPVLLTGAALEGASPQLAPSGIWTVNPAFLAGPDGIDAFNAAAARCFHRTHSCPMGQLALVLDGVVLVAPIIEQDRFDRDQIQISGDLSEESAKDLAAVLESGPLAVTLAIRD